MRFFHQQGSAMQKSLFSEEEENICETEYSVMQNNIVLVSEWPLVVANHFTL